MKLRKLLLFMCYPQPVRVVTDIDDQGENFAEIYRGDSDKVGVGHGNLKIVDVHHTAEYLEIEVE